jgi:hypothetical protein
MSMEHKRLDQNNVAGDDGLTVTKDVERTLGLIRTMGDVAGKKTFIASEGCCIHLKRPIRRIGDRLVAGDVIPWPSLEIASKPFDGRYPYLRQTSKIERRQKMAGSITAFLRKLEYQQLSDNEIDLVDTFMKQIYHDFVFPRNGCITQIQHNPLGFVPAYERRYIGLCPITNTINRHYNGIAKLPLREYMKFEYSFLQERTFCCNSTKLLGTLERLGYVEREKQIRHVFGEEGYLQLLKEYNDAGVPVFRYRVLDSLPVWITDYR